jgi:hypothetical protein
MMMAVGGIMTYMTNKGGWEKYHPTTPHTRITQKA